MTVHLPFIRSGKNRLARHSERAKKTRQTEEEVGRHHLGMDRPEVRQVPEGSGEQGKWRKLVTKSSVVPRRPSRLRDRWDDENLKAFFFCLVQRSAKDNNKFSSSQHHFLCVWRATYKQPEGNTIQRSKDRPRSLCLEARPDSYLQRKKLRLWFKILRRCCRDSSLWNGVSSMKQNFRKDHLHCK